MSLTNIPNELYVKIKATHFNFVNKNNVFYTENAVTRGVKSWTVPYNKPQLVAHNSKGDPIGRIVDYEIIKGTPKTPNEPTDYVQITARITDKDAIEKVLDGRYLTVSVGSESCRVICSECGQILTEDGLCEHKKGTYNEKGEPIYWLIDQIGYTEDSFVNEPADEFAMIEEVQINGEWVNYTKFSDNRETYLSVIKLEDYMANTDAKLSTEQRKKLPDSAFCGPNKSFPAHDKAHVTAGLRLLNKAKLSDSAKDKIKACLYRKGKKYGIVPQKDEVDENFDILFRMEDDFTAEETSELKSWFEENPDSDLPKVENADTTSTTESNTDSKTEEKNLEDMNIEELKAKVEQLRKDLEDAKSESKKAVETRDAKIDELQDKVQRAETIAYEKEDELNKYVDKCCVFENKYKDAVISNVIDLKMADNTNDEREELEGKLKSRTLESLEDSLNDLRNIRTANTVNSEERVKDPTQQDDNTSSTSTQTDEVDSEENNDLRFNVFSVDRRKTEADQ